MHLRLLHVLAIPPVHRRSRDVRADPSPVPYTPDVVPRYDLSKSSRLYVPDLNESAVKEQDVRRVQRHSLGGAFPFYGTRRPARVTVLIDVDSKFWR